MNRTPLHGVLATLRRWHERRLALQALSRLDDHLLHDIGIDRHQIAAVAEGRLNGTALNAEAKLPTAPSAAEPRPYPARPAGIHGPAARDWPPAFENATGANYVRVTDKVVIQTC